MKTYATSDQTQIALIQKDISNIQTNIFDIKTVLKEGYVTKDSLFQTAKDTETRLIRLESSSNLWKWLSPSLAAIMGSVLTFFIIEYFIRLYK